MTYSEGGIDLTSDLCVKLSNSALNLAHLVEARVERDQRFVVKRVPEDFDWPVGKTWHGYLNPWPGPRLCDACEGTGLNAATKHMLDKFFTWAHRITKEEERILLSVGYTPKDVADLKLRKGSPKVELQQRLLEVRAKRKGVFGICHHCSGEGYVPNDHPSVVALYAGVNLYAEWEPSEPPVGRGWQLWSADSGMPYSPVFLDQDALASWCSNEFDQPFEKWRFWVDSSAKLAELKRPPPRAPLRLDSDTYHVYHRKEERKAES